MRLCPSCTSSYPSTRSDCPACGARLAVVDGFTAFAPALDTPDTGGFNPDGFAGLARNEARSFWFRARNQLILWAIARYAPDLRKMLEIGCGTGFVLQALVQHFPKAQFMGSELYSRGLHFAAARVPSAQLWQMDARNICHRDEFDVIGAFDVLEHIPEDEAVLAQIHQALVAGGHLVLSVPQHPWLWSHADDYAHHQRRYTAHEMHAKLRRAGFEIVRSTSFVTLLLPAMMLSRVMQRNKPVTEYDPMAELQLNPVLNSLFYALLQVERLMIRAGLSLPVGGSRLVVARKTGIPQ
jgi:SAM-dependent methyltransferase